MRKAPSKLFFDIGNLLFLSMFNLWQCMCHPANMKDSIKKKGGNLLNEVNMLKGR